MWVHAQNVQYLTHCSQAIERFNSPVNSNESVTLNNNGACMMDHNVHIINVNNISILRWCWRILCEEENYNPSLLRARITRPGRRGKQLLILWHTIKNKSNFKKIINDCADFPAIFEDNCPPFVWPGLSFCRFSFEVRMVCINEHVNKVLHKNCDSRKFLYSNFIGVCKNHVF